MTERRRVGGLAHHPLTVVALFGLVLFLFGFSLVHVVGQFTAQSRVSTVPDAQQDHDSPPRHPPRSRVEGVHAALHRLGRECTRPTKIRRSAVLTQTLSDITDFAADFPSGDFRLDDENGTTLALLVVVWDELKSCAPARVEQVESLIPLRSRSG